jgi:hypothetical protein
VDFEDKWYWDRVFRRFRYLPQPKCPECGNIGIYMGLLPLEDETVYACKKCHSVYEEIDGELRKKGAFMDVIDDG